MKRSTFATLSQSVAVLAVLTMAIPTAFAAPPARQTAAVTAEGQRFDGYMPFIWEPAKGRVLLEIPAFDEDILYYVSAATNPGSVEAPFDRGVLYSSVIHFVRSGGKVVVNRINLDYRAVHASAKTQEGVSDSFPSSVLAVLPVESDMGGKVVVDATALFMRDAAGITTRLKRAKMGDFKFDQGRSVFYPKRMKAFPENTEIETIATFASDAPGNAISAVTPDPGVLTMRIHHSFLKAPTGYVPRDADPRIGVSAIRFKDFSKPFDEAPDTQWITRWRLEKKDPNAALSEPVKPITYYFDPAIPDPIRAAMKTGLLWWNKAFEAAGFKNAIRAEDAPADMDPMDIRYAYVLWIQRDERGFSSSGNYSDPRTGETLGAKTHMDTFRMRTIASYYDAYRGGLPVDGSGITVADPSIVDADAFSTMPKAQRDMALLRQALLTAHELGHTLGFQHNWAANQNDRSSVMEYPTPRVKVTNGKLDLSESFMTSIGAYDTYMVRYAYTPFAVPQERAGLDGVVKDMRDHGIVFTLDSDPRWTWYDDRGTPEENLRETAAVRKIALAQYGTEMLKPGEPLGNLRDMRLWIVYLQQRYAIESAVKYIGGMVQNISVKGEAHPLPPTEFVPGARQRRILGQLLETLEPGNLEIPESLLIQLTPMPGQNLEDLSKDDVFDQLRAARILAAQVIEPLFDADRAARIVALSARQPGALTFPELVDTVLASSWNAARGPTPRERSLRRAVQAVTLQGMMMLGGSTDGSPEARAFILDRLDRLATNLKERTDPDALTTAFYRQSARDIARYLEDPVSHAPKSSAPAWGEGPRSRSPFPPGPPLGG